MRIIRATIMALAAMNVSCGLFADPVDVNNIEWTYTLSGGKVILGGGSARHTAIPTTVCGDLVVPETIDGREVVEINDYAFAGCSGLTSVVVPDCVTRIGIAAFNECSSLTNMVLPFVGSERGNVGTRESLFGYVFGSEAYDGGEKIVSWSQWQGNNVGIAGTNYIPVLLKSVTISDESRIGYGAFERCNMLESVNLNDGIDELVGSTFHRCSGLKSISMPQGITSLNTHDFEYCSALTNFNCPVELKRIGNSVFHGCSNLASVAFSPCISELSNNAFQDCTSLKDITIPNSVTNIGSAAFSGCSSLTNMVLPFVGAARRSDQPTYTIEAAFGYIFGTASYTGGVATQQKSGEDNSVYYTFYIPETLKSVEITDERRETGAGAFRNCSSLKRVILSEGIGRIRGGCFQGCTNLEDIYIPNTVTQLIDSAFADCGNLQRVVIPGSVQEFNNTVFRNCTNLKAVLFEGNAPKMGNDDFISTASGCTAYVMPGSTGWNVTIPGKWQGINIDYFKSVTFDPNGASVSCEPRWVVGGDAVGELPTIERSGYAFDGWYTAKTGGTKISASTKVSANATYYAHWNANSYSIAYDANGGVGTTDATDCIYDDEGIVASSAFSRPGYEFIGWAVEAGENPPVVYAAGQAVTNLTDQAGGTVTLYAVWKLLPPTFTPENGSVYSGASLTVSLASEAEGALIYYTTDGSDPTAESTEYRRFRVSGKTTVKAIAVCGSQTSDIAIAEYAPGRCADPVFSLADGAEFAHSNQIVKIKWNNDGVLRYTTDGSEPTPESTVYETPLAFNESVVLKAKVFSDEFLDSAIASASLTRIWEHVATPVVDAAATFTGSKAKITLTCATDGAEIRYTLDGSEPGESSIVYVKPFYVTDDCTVKAYAVMPDYLDSGIVTHSIAKEWTIGDTMGKPDHGFSTDGTGGNGWSRVSDATAPGGESMKSGSITHGGTSTLSTTVMGPGTLSFSWRTSCEDAGGYYDWDHAEFAVDGETLLNIDGITEGWKRESVAISGDGEHVVEWRYVKDEAEYEGEDAAWVANYNWRSDWTATRTTEIPVPYVWLSAHDEGVADEYETYESAAKQTGANGYKRWESYVIGADPNDKDDRLRITAFPMKADGTPDLANMTFEPSKEKWNVQSAKPVIKGKASLDDTAEDWQTISDGGEATFRFFRVTVELP